MGMSCRARSWLYGVIVAESMFAGSIIVLIIQMAMGYNAAGDVKTMTDEIFESLPFEPLKEDQQDVQPKLLIATIALTVFFFVHLLFVTLLVCGKAKRHLCMIVAALVWIIIYNIALIGGLVYIACDIYSSPRQQPKMPTLAFKVPKQQDGQPIPFTLPTVTLPAMPELPPNLKAPIDALVNQAYNDAPWFLYSMAIAKFIMAVFCVTVISFAIRSFRRNRYRRPSKL